MLGLGFLGDKYLSAFAFEVIPGNTSREWESESEKCTLPSHYQHGQLELSRRGNTGREYNMIQSYPAQGERERGY